MCLNKEAAEPFETWGVGWRVSPKGLLYTGFPRSLTDGYAMLKSPNTGETAVHGCHCPNLTTSWLAQLGERRSAECVFR